MIKILLIIYVNFQRNTGFIARISERSKSLFLRKIKGSIIASKYSIVKIKEKVDYEKLHKHAFCHMKYS